MSSRPPLATLVCFSEGCPHRVPQKPRALRSLRFVPPQPRRPFVPPSFMLRRGARDMRPSSLALILASTRMVCTSPSPPARVCVERGKLLSVSGCWAEYIFPQHDMPPHECFFGESITTWQSPFGNEQLWLFGTSKPAWQGCKSDGLSWKPRASNSSSAWAPPSVQAFWKGFQGDSIEPFYKIQFYDGASTVASNISSVFLDDAGPQYGLIWNSTGRRKETLRRYDFCSSLDRPWTSFTIELWGHGRWSDELLSSRTFHAPRCSGVWWMPMQTPSHEYKCGRYSVQGERAAHFYYGELEVSVVVSGTDANSHNACALEPDTPPIVPYDLDPARWRSRLRAHELRKFAIAWTGGLVIGLAMLCFGCCLLDLQANIRRPALY